MNDASEAWLQLLRNVRMNGREVSPRGRRTREVAMPVLEMDMRRPVVCVPARKLSYGFMAAEAFWILTGDDRVETIAPWNKRIADYSDDGVTFFGAYGVKVLGQMDYVVAKLLEDHDTRQAGLTIWRENPPKTRDVPCTLAMFFSIRSGLLEANVFMRSNDAWLGTPYDVANFSMISHLVCARLNTALGRVAVSPGALRLVAASSHLYEENWAAADDVAPLSGYSAERPDQPRTPDVLFQDAEVLRMTLRELRDSKPGSPLRWWQS